MRREKYFVTVDMPLLGISDVKTEDNSIQYEIEATHEEKEEIKDLLDALQEQDIEFQQIFGHPFDEPASDEEKSDAQFRVEKLYQRIYDLGTDETKHTLKEMGGNLRTE
ncbi:hypothetical protein [Salsuginibacillus kocurii]|uniref:hypothetical protein n=1 Tax=Salsuginibacillus kocurii TaxID=427078 RepID=UPI000380FC31|nr:hypothetical protein [Salsuginibacillus kocurii]